jgi:hypothetical protein
MAGRGDMGRAETADAEGILAAGALAMKHRVSLSWTDPANPCDECAYDHTIAETPFGRFLLTWKSWKTEPWQDMGLGFDETPWGEACYDGWDTVEDAKMWAENEMARRCMELLKANKEVRVLG